jgi:hypothetical protein
MPRRMLAFASIAVVGMGLASVATPAQAAQKKQRCVVETWKPNSPITCYDSSAVAIADATGGRTTDAPNDARTATNDPFLQARLNKTGAKKKKKKGRVTTAGSPAPAVILFDKGAFAGASITYETNRNCPQQDSERDFERSD